MVKEKKRGSPNAHPHASKRLPRHGEERRTSIYHILCIQPACIRLTRARSSARCTARRESRITDLSSETNFYRICACRALISDPSAFRSTLLVEIIAKIVPLIRIAWNLQSNTRKVAETK